MLDLKGLRYELNVSQKELAEMFKCSQSHVSALEIGIRNFTRFQIQVLTDKFGQEIIDKYTVDEIPKVKDVINIKEPTKVEETNNVKNNNGAVGAFSTFNNVITDLTEKDRTIEQQKELISSQKSQIEYLQKQIEFFQDLVTKLTSK